MLVYRLFVWQSLRPFFRFIKINSKYGEQLSRWTLAFRHCFSGAACYDVRIVLRPVQDVHYNTPFPHSDAGYAATRALPVISA